MNYYTSDLHLCFEPILAMADRPFESIQDMNDTIIENINKRVTKNDVLYINGDIAYAGADISYIVHLLKKINGQKVLIVGNHDRQLLKKSKFRKCFKEIHEELLLTDGEYDIFLSHCPRAEWDGFYKGRYHFYAHVHGKKDGGAALIDLLPQAINVGVDVHNFMPLTAEELIIWRKRNYKMPSNPGAFIDAVLNPDIDLSRSPKAHKFLDAGLIYVLDESEVDVLNQIARNCKLAWFSIIQVDGKDYILDLEEDKTMSLKEGISLLAECINNKELYESIGLKEENDKTFRNLLNRFGTSLSF